MKFIWILIICSSVWADLVRETYQFDAPSFSPNLRRHTFGLSPHQLSTIYELTEGKVDLRYHYFRDSFTSSILSILSPLGFRGFIRNNVPPPGFFDGEGLDPELDKQYWIEQIQAAEAWRLATGKGITIADCDSGYYTTETDLAPNFLTDHRYDLADKDNPFNVSDGPWIFHGTAVSAIMASVKDGKGTNGIAYDAKIVPLQNFNYDEKDDLDKEEATARCVLRALTIQNVKVIVLENQTASGSSETFAGTREAVKLALNTGITIVSAAGNFSAELTTEAENDTGSIIVGALNQNGKMAGFSNHGDRVSIAAFGENLHTLYGPNGQMGKFGGTSGATPQVAGTVALMLEANPALTPAQVKNILIETRVESVETKRVGGLVNTLAAVTKAKAAPQDSSEAAESNALLAKVRDILGNP